MQPLYSLNNYQNLQISHVSYVFKVSLLISYVAFLLLLLCNFGNMKQILAVAKLSLNIFKNEHIFKIVFIVHPPYIFRRGGISFPEFTAMATNELRTQVEKTERQCEFDEPINIQFTSGTTGLPKGATLTHRGIVNNALTIGNRLGYHLMEKNIQRRPVICSPLPFYHCFGEFLSISYT